MLTPPLVSPYASPEYARAALTDLLTRHAGFDRVAQLQEGRGSLWKPSWPRPP
ncbi:hypothetical protein SAMN05660350_01217 [Geodermatophilus obscurus]|uniref:Uncharacterized protein n=1 Tax=Geodermatophilus obscurus TaxID=1861 RepID=A0A1M7T0H9_9ACTN|nr:hypothetical protein SAMN05660350_01217 [Geodermatophilus obscurus]